jgi:hypothetical protein
VHSTLIPEWKMHYYDAGYNEETGEFGVLSEEAEADYKQDVRDFYIAFTGGAESEQEPMVGGFSDIRLGSASLNHVRKNKNVTKTPNTSSLFSQYAANLKQMIQSTREKRAALRHILDSLFETDGSIVQISESIDAARLDQLIEKATLHSKQMYTECEQYYMKGLQIYEAILESLLIKTTQRQLGFFENERESLIRGVK